MNGGRVRWEGPRSALHDEEVVPYLESPLPVSIGVGASPESQMLTAHYGFSLMLVIIAGPPARFAPHRARPHLEDDRLQL